MRFSGELSTAGEPPGISSVVLRTETDAVFSVVHERGSAYLKATVTAEGGELVHSVPQEVLDEESLLTRELSLTGEDAGFKAALAEALALEKSFG